MVKPGLYICLFISCSLPQWSIAQTESPCAKGYLTDTLLNYWVGDWFGSGTVSGQQVGYSVHAEWVLEHQFVLIQLKDTAQIPQYDAHIYFGYNCDENHYSVHWIDNFGAAFSQSLGYGIRDYYSIPLHFDYPEGKMVNTFTYDPVAQTWRSSSVYLTQENTWAKFADITFTKK